MRVLLYKIWDWILSVLLGLALGLAFNFILVTAKYLGKPVANLLLDLMETIHWIIDKLVKQ